MRFLFRWAFRLFLVLVVLVVALVLLKDSILRSLTERRIRAETGLEVRLGKFEVGLLSPTLTIQNLKIYNSAEFGGSPLVDLPELHFECDTAALASKKLRFKLVRLNLSELNVVESRNGRTNTAAFFAEIEKLASTNEPPKIGRKFDFGGIDILNLTIGRITYASLKRPSQNMEANVGLKNEIITDVQSLPQLSNVFVTILLNRGITFVNGPAVAPANSTATANPSRRSLSSQGKR